MLKKTCDISKITQKNSIAIILLLALVISQFNNTNAAEDDDDSSCVGKPNGWKYEDPLDCHGFYACLEGRAFQTSCEHFEKFDEDTRMCVVGKCPPCKKCNTDCPAPTTPQTPSTTPPTQPTQPTPAPFDPSRMDCRDEKLGPLYRSLNNCRVYYQCRNRQRVKFNCPEGQWFDDRVDRCELKAKVKCPANKD